MPDAHFTDPLWEPPLKVLPLHSPPLRISEVIVSAGGSAVFDLVAACLRPALGCGRFGAGRAGARRGPAHRTERLADPCTTFGKWHWMPVVDEDDGVRDATSIHF